MRPRTVLALPAWYPTARQPLVAPFVRNHILAAAALGHRMVVVVDEGPSDEVRGLYSVTRERDQALDTVRLKYRPKTGTLAYLPAVLSVARRLAREGAPVEVVHAHIHRMGWAGVIVGALLRRPVVISEQSSEWPAHTLSRGALRRARIALPRAALICPISARLRRAIESYGIRGRFRVVPNTVDTSIFYPPRERRSGPPRRLLNVAFHVEVKGLDVLLRAFARIAPARPDLALELIGTGPITDALKDLADELDIKERVHFKGAAQTAEIAAALRNSDVFVLSSLSETGPLVVLEALCSGLPVVSTDVGGVSEALGSDGALAPPGDPEALAAAMNTVLDDYARFDRAEIAARAARQFSFEAVGRVLDEIYQSL